MTIATYVSIGLAAFSVICAIIGFFLKRTMNKVDSNEQEIRDIRDDYVRKEDHERQLKEHQRSIEKLEKRIEERFDKVEQDISVMKRETLLKEDFYREINKLNDKSDRMTNLLLEGRQGQ